RLPMLTEQATTSPYHKEEKSKKFRLNIPVNWEASGIEPDAGVEPATLRLRVSRSTD
ncbi:hypothetical protein F4819DRAFT_471691, partial [Hypoxylon fuscum]